MLLATSARSRRVSDMRILSQSFSSLVIDSGGNLHCRLPYSIHNGMCEAKDISDLGQNLLYNHNIWNHPLSYVGSSKVDSSLNLKNRLFQVRLAIVLHTQIKRVYHNTSRQSNRLITRRPSGTYSQIYNIPRA